MTRRQKADEISDEPTPAAEANYLPPLSRPALIILGLYFVFFAWLFFHVDFPELFGRELPASLNKDGSVVRAIKTISLLSIPLLLSFIPLYAALRRIKVYEEFVEGAKEGFPVILRIIPYLVAILVAIGMFRGAGGIDMITRWLTPVMDLIHFPPELLPMALMRPLSGSGTLGVFSDLVNKFGPDHNLSRMAGTIYGSTETTFYVLAVYFGAVNTQADTACRPGGVDCGCGGRDGLCGYLPNCVWMSQSWPWTAAGDRGRESGCPPPLPPNRTGGSPASGFPVSGCSVERERLFASSPRMSARLSVPSPQINCAWLTPPPVSPCGHSLRFFVRCSFRHSSTFLRPFAPRSLPASQLLRTL